MRTRVPLILLGQCLRSRAASSPRTAACGAFPAWSSRMNSSSSRKPRSSISSASSRTTALSSDNVERAAPQVIAQAVRACRRRYGRRWPSSRCSRARIHAADAGDDPRAGMAIEPVKLALDLQGEFARRRDDQRQRRCRPLEALGLAEQVVGDRQSIGDGLAGAGLRRDQEIAAVGLGGQHGGLDRRRLVVAALGQGAGERRTCGQGCHGDQTFIGASAPETLSNASNQTVEAAAAVNCAGRMARRNWMRWARFRAFAAKAPCNVGDMVTGVNAGTAPSVYTIDITTNISIAAPHNAVIPAKAGIQYAAASRFYYWRLWNTGSPAGACHRAAIRPTRWRVTTPDVDPRSRGALRPRFAGNSSPSRKQRAQGMPDARCTRGLMCNG